MVAEKKFCYTTHQNSGSDDWLHDVCVNQQTYWKLSVVKPLIKEKDTCMRKLTSFHENLTATVRLLAIGRFYEDIMSFKFGDRNVINCCLFVPI